MQRWCQGERMKRVWNPSRTADVCGVPVSLSLHYRGLSICLHNRDVYNHTSDTLLLPFLHTHSCQLSITGEYVMTTYRIASWLNIAKPLWLWLNCARCALHLLSKQESSFSMCGHGEGSRVITFHCHVGALWNFACLAGGTRSCWFCSALEV